MQRESNDSRFLSLPLTPNKKALAISRADYTIGVY